MKLAVFDIDGTLTAKHSLEYTFVGFLFRNKPWLAVMQLWRWPITYLSLRGKDFAIYRNKSYLKGFSETQLTALVEEFAKTLPAQLSPFSIDLFTKVKAQPETEILLLSGTLEPLAEALAKYLGIRRYVAAALETQDGVYTGRAIGIFPRGQSKVTALENYLSEQQLHYEKISAYADHAGDQYLLSHVDEAHMVNPDATLRRYGLARSWRLEEPSRTK